MTTLKVMVMSRWLNGIIEGIGLFLFALNKNVNQMLQNELRQD